MMYMCNIYLSSAAKGIFSSQLPQQPESHIIVWTIAFDIDKLLETGKLYYKHLSNFKKYKNARGTNASKNFVD